MNQDKKHWRLLTNKEYLVGEMLPEDGVTLTVKAVEKTEVQSQKGPEQKPVMSFEETKLKIVFNITNLKKAAEVLETPYPAQWVGKKLTFIRHELFAFGKQQISIRIK